MHKINDKGRVGRPKRRNTINLGQVSKISVLKKNIESFDDLNETKYVIFSIFQ